MHSQLSGQQLEVYIRGQIEASGPVTFAQFMAWALYHAEHGYYMTGPRIGPRGDFTTSPEASPAFGKLLAKHVAEVDTLLQCPASLDVVECGPGRGTLAKQLLDSLHEQYPAVYSRVKYWLVEISPSLAGMQRDLLVPSHGSLCRWVPAIEEIPHRFEGAVLANEFLDAFPVHVIENHDGVLTEQFVECGADGNFALSLGKPSDPALVHFLEVYRIDLQPGQRVEVNLGMTEWLGTLGQQMKRGVAVIFDYGDTSPARYSEARRQGTLLGYSNGTVTADITANPGRQDLTALVDFTALQDAAADGGLITVSLTRQANFLLGLGLAVPIDDNQVGASASDINAFLEQRRGIQALVSMEGLGRFHVAVLAKGLDSAQVRNTLSGLQYADI